MTDYTLLNEDLNNFRAMLMAASNYKEISQDTIEDCIVRLREVLMGQSLENQFNLIGYGAFKETFDLDENFVLKFASQHNNTDAESEILCAAEEVGVSQLFLPAWYCPLRFAQPSLLELEDSDSYRWYYNYDYHTYVENENWQGINANHAIVQLRVSTIADNIGYTPMPYYAKDYEKNPLYDENGEPIEWKYVEMFWVSPREWLQDIINNYGVEFFKKAAQFMQDNNISDLHNNNIGYYVRPDGVEIPVIFDWLSDS